MFLFLLADLFTLSRCRMQCKVLTFAFFCFYSVNILDCSALVEEFQSCTAHTLVDANARKTQQTFENLNEKHSWTLCIFFYFISFLFLFNCNVIIKDIRRHSHQTWEYRVHKLPSPNRPYKKRNAWNIFCMETSATSSN